MKRGDHFLEVYRTLDRALGPQHWWPGETDFEIVVGAILTQSTAWTNVEKAIANLGRNRLLTPRAMDRVDVKRLAGLIRPSGYFNQKAVRLKNFLAFLSRYGSLKKMFSTPKGRLRREMLALNGIGPETADSILLYAAGHPVFVVDAYTKRIFSRHGWVDEKVDYETMQNLFHEYLPRSVRMFNQYHALLVNVGKNFCRRRKPLCGKCPLEALLPHPRGGCSSL